MKADETRQPYYGKKMTVDREPQEFASITSTAQGAIVAKIAP
jgi:hypothetical protein